MPKSENQKRNWRNWRLRELAKDPLWDKWRNIARYGMSREQYTKLNESQNGKCAICGTEPVDGEFLHVDHDHETNKIRGLVCNLCNRGIGMLRDDPAILEAAARYLRRQIDE